MTSMKLLCVEMDSPGYRPERGTLIPIYDMNGNLETHARVHAVGESKMILEVEDWYAKRESDIAELERLYKP